MTYYAGLDVSLRSTHISSLTLSCMLRAKQTRRLKTSLLFSMSSASRSEVGLEAGTLTADLRIAVGWL